MPGPVAIEVNQTSSLSSKKSSEARGLCLSGTVEWLLLVFQYYPGGDRESSLWGESGWERGRRRETEGCEEKRVLLKCLALWSMLAQIAEVQWPGKGEIKRPKVNMRTKRLLSIWKEVQDI